MVVYLFWLNACLFYNNRLNLQSNPWWLHTYMHTKRIHLFYLCVASCLQAVLRNQAKISLELKCNKIVKLQTVFMPRLKDNE